MGGEGHVGLREASVPKESEHKGNSCQECNGAEAVYEAAATASAWIVCGWIACCQSGESSVDGGEHEHELGEVKAKRRPRQVVGVPTKNLILL